MGPREQRLGNEAADAVFLRSPDSIFEEHPALIGTGTLFFHDRAATGGDDNRRNWVKDQIKAAGIQPSNYFATESLFYEGAAWYEQDSGVVAMDRSRPHVILGLMFTTWMNTKRVRDEVTYKVFYGDKESFWVAMELAGFEYAFQPWYAGTMGTLSQENENLDEAVEMIASLRLGCCRPLPALGGARLVTSAIHSLHISCVARRPAPTRTTSHNTDAIDHSAINNRQLVDLRKCELALRFLQ